MNLHQTPEDIIKAATPAQRILWNHLFLKFGERIALSQLYYQGPVAGSEFLTYNARKMYFALQYEHGGACGSGANAGYTNFYSETNVINFIISNDKMIWDATAAAPRYLVNTAIAENVIFSKILVSGTLTYIRFHGYRITI
jgi:hypothetical protein